MTWRELSNAARVQWCHLAPNATQLHCQVHPCFAKAFLLVAPSGYAGCIGMLMSAECAPMVAVAILQYWQNIVRKSLPRFVVMASVKCVSIIAGMLQRGSDAMESASIIPGLTCDSALLFMNVHVVLRRPDA